MQTTTRLWILLALTFCNGVAMAQTQGPLTQQLQSDAPKPVQAQSFAIVNQAQAATPSTAAPAVTNTPVVTNQTAVQNAQATRVYTPRAQIGEATRLLLAAQARPERRGQDHTVLGTTATRSWERYLNSFEHAIPQEFEGLDFKGSK